MLVRTFFKLDCVLEVISGSYYGNLFIVMVIFMYYYSALLFLFLAPSLPTFILRTIYYKKTKLINKPVMAYNTSLL